MPYPDLCPLQINELLSEIRVDYEAEAGIERFVAKLKKALAAIPEHEVRIHRDDPWFASMHDALCQEILQRSGRRADGPCLTRCPMHACAAQVKGSLTAGFLQDLGLDPSEVRCTALHEGGV